MNIPSSSNFPSELLSALQQIIPNCGLQIQHLSDIPIDLWLIPPVFPSERLDDDVILQIWQIRPIGFFVGHLV